MILPNLYSTLKRNSAFFVILFGAFFLSGCQKLPFLQKNQTGGLQVNLDGVTASVFLNGEFANKTPYIDKNLKVGTYTVKIEPEESQLSPYETSVTIYSGTLAVINWTAGASPEESGGVIFEMEPLNRKNSALSITSIPDSTIVSVDNESKGFTPALVEDISTGDHEVKISLPSYKTQDHRINIVEGMKMHMMVKLAKVKTATESAMLDTLEASDEASTSAKATASAKPKASATPKSSPKASVTPKASSTPKPTTSASSTSSATVAKPYVKISETPTGFLRVRAVAGSSGTEVAQVKPGEMFPFSQTSKDSSNQDWHEIEYQTGKKGWVSGQYSEVVK